MTKTLSHAGTEQYLEIPMANTGDIQSGQWNRKTVNLGMSMGLGRNVRGFFQAPILILCPSSSQPLVLVFCLLHTYLYLIACLSCVCLSLVALSFCVYQWISIAILLSLQELSFFIIIRFLSLPLILFH